MKLYVYDHLRSLPVLCASPHDFRFKKFTGRTCSAGK